MFSSASDHSANHHPKLQGVLHCGKPQRAGRKPEVTPVLARMVESKKNPKISTKTILTSSSGSNRWIRQSSRYWTRTTQTQKSSAGQRKKALSSLLWLDAVEMELFRCRDERKRKQNTICTIKHDGGAMQKRHYEKRVHHEDSWEKHQAVCRRTCRIIVQIYH